MSLGKVSNISTNLNPCDIVDVPTPWRLKSYAEPLQKWLGLASQSNRLIDDKTFFHVLPSGQKHSDLNNIHRFSTFTALTLSQTKQVRTILPVCSICYSYVSFNMSQYVFLPSDWTPIWNLCQGLRDGRTVPWNTNGKAQIRPNEFLQVIASCHGPNDGAKAAKAAKRQQERLPKHGQVAKMRPSRRYPWGSSAC